MTRIRTQVGYPKNQYTSEPLYVGRKGGEWRNREVCCRSGLKRNYILPTTFEGVVLVFSDVYVVGASTAVIRKLRWHRQYEIDRVNGERVRFHRRRLPPVVCRLMHRHNREFVGKQIWWWPEYIAPGLS